MRRTSGPSSCSGTPVNGIVIPMRMRQYLSPMFPRTALVTGGASGIGAAIVELLRSEGAAVEVLDVRHGFDVADPRAWDGVGALDLACLNAGVITGETDVARLADDTYRRVVGVNVDGVVFGVRRLATVLEKGSAIVVTASLAGVTSLERDPVYSLTKHAVIGFVRSVAPQLEERGIRINAVAPGIADTPMIDGPLRKAIEGAGFPLLKPAEVANAVLIAARSDETGQVWAVQPGREPIQFRFPNVPGPRDPSGARVGRPPA
jgi:NAD(P)-dependent dehydrogenase (short-subunit alcohol dehydrogenase family)